MILPNHNLSRLLVTTMVLVTLLGQSLVVIAAPCAGGGHDHGLSMTSSHEGMDHIAHHHDVMHHDMSGHSHHEIDDAFSEPSCCGKDPASCAMNFGLTVFPPVSALLLEARDDQSFERSDLQAKYVTQKESLFRPPISS